MNCIYTSVKQISRKSLLLLTLFLASVTYSFSQGDGAKIFKSNCSRCHTIGKGKLTGPDLKDVASRVPAPADDWMHKWIKNNKAVLKSGDAYANKIFNENDKQNMDVFDGILSDADISAVIAYVKNPPVEKKEEKPTTTAEGQPEEKGLGEFTVLLVIAIALIFLVAVLGNVRKSLQDSLNAKKGLPPSEPVGAVKWASQNKRLFVLILILLGGITVRAIYIGVMNIGVYETYKPEQPIKFSHKVHAGKLSINCVYCHSGAEKGKTSGVPSANVCMNCHKAISEGPLTGKVEIAKIYDAVGWDPATGKYDKPQHPLKWNRVHALPDFAYFNHSQHVVVGKQDCKNCHGDVASMDVAEQKSPLTMGWCVECHRKTEVPGMATNPYYAELHAKLKEKYGKAPITVEKMGGLDCIKCHY